MCLLYPLLDMNRNCNVLDSGYGTPFWEYPEVVMKITYYYYQITEKAFNVILIYIHMFINYTITFMLTLII